MSRQKKRRKKDNSKINVALNAADTSAMMMMMKSDQAIWLVKMAFLSHASDYRNM